MSRLTPAPIAMGLLFLTGTVAIAAAANGAAPADTPAATAAPTPATTPAPTNTDADRGPVLEEVTVTENTIFDDKKREALSRF